VTKTRRSRPVLATVISLWEVAVVVTAIAAHVAIRMRHEAYQTPYQAAQSVSHTVPASPLHIPGLVLGYALAIAGAVALWRMHRSAFIFLAARVVVEVALPILAPASHAKTHDSLIPLFVFIIDVCAFALNAAIAWYAYRVTKPKRRSHRRRRTRRSHQVPEFGPTQEANPEPPPEAQDAPLSNSTVATLNETLDSTQSVSQFYLSKDEDQRKSN